MTGSKSTATFPYLILMALRYVAGYLFYAMLLSRGRTGMNNAAYLELDRSAFSMFIMKQLQIFLYTTQSIMLQTEIEVKEKQL